MRALPRLALLAASLLPAIASCEKKHDLAGPPSDCAQTSCNDPPARASKPSGGGGAGGGAGGSAGAGGATIGIPVDQQGTVHRISSPSFDDGFAVAYTASATIVAYPSGGAQMSTSYGGATGQTFAFTAIPSGPTWFLVQDQTSGGSGALSTLSFANLPVATGLALPVVDLGVLQNIANSLPSVAMKGVSSLAAQVVLRLQRSGSPLKGITVSGGSGAAQLAYDIGPSFSDSATATGTAGIVILFNAALMGKATVTFTDTADQSSHSAEIMAAPGAATLVTIEL
jgi:hypothetical protein